MNQAENPINRAIYIHHKLICIYIFIHRDEKTSKLLNKLDHNVSLISTIIY